LVVYQGASFTGLVDGGNTIGGGSISTMELTSGASAGTITGLGTGIIDFTSLVFDSGAHWKVAGNDAANGLGSLGVSGFSAGDTIELNGFVAANRTFASNTLTLGDGVGDYETLHIQASFATSNFQITNTSGNTDVTLVVPCYRRGTRILTDHGEVAVEDLVVGDLCKR
jgi:hypothetical protein